MLELEDFQLQQLVEAAAEQVELGGVEKPRGLHGAPDLLRGFRRIFDGAAMCARTSPGMAAGLQEVHRAESGQTRANMGQLGDVGNN